MTEPFDKIIIGAGLYGLYSALYCGNRGEKFSLLNVMQVHFAGLLQSIKHGSIKDTIIQDRYRQHSNRPAILNGLIKTTVSVLIGNSSKSMQHHVNFPCRMENIS